MNRNKLLKCILIIIILIPVGIVTTWIITHKINQSIADEVSIEEEYTDPLVDNFDCDVMIYGKDLGFLPELKVRHLSGITDATLSDTDADYEFLIVNNCDGNTLLTVDEQNLIQNYIDEKGYNFFYIGTDAEKLIFDFDAESAFNYIVYESGIANISSDNEYDAEALKEDPTFEEIRYYLLDGFDMIIKHYKEPVPID